MNITLSIAAVLLVLTGIAHSWLGERYILTRLFRHADLPRLFGGTDFTRRTLRFAWHITSIAWLGIAALLLAIAQGRVDVSTIGSIITATFVAHGLLSLVGSRGRHVSWIVFCGDGGVMSGSPVLEATVHEQFARRRLRQLFALVPVLAALAVVFWADRHPGQSLAGIDAATLPVAMFAVVAAVAVFSLVNWRCPACSASLGRGWNPRFCRSCGVSLRA